LNPKINPQKQYIPKLYGFKIFGKKGSNYYELVKSAKKHLNAKGNNDKEKSSGDKKIEALISKFNGLNIS
jgi:hypothetical protein